MLSGVALLTAAPAQAAPGDPFDPADPLVFIAQGVPTGLFTAQTSGEGTVSFTPEGPTSDITYNAIAYRTVDNYVYAMVNGGNDTIPPQSLIRIGQDGAYTRVGTDTYAPSVVGTFGPEDGFYYTYAGVEGVPSLQVIDVETGAVVRITPLTGDPIPAADFAYADGYLWMMGAGFISRTDPATGVTARWEIPFPTDPAPDQGGAAWTFGNGNLGFSYNGSGTVYQVAVSNPAAAEPTFTLVASSPGPSTSNNDGTSSPGLPTDLSLVKEGPEAVVPGGTVTYTLTVTNNGPGNSSGYVVNDTVPSSLTDVSTDDPGCTVTGNAVSCVGGRLVAGDSVTYTITASVPDDVEATVENTATVTSNEEDPDPGNNTSTSTSGRAELSIVKRAGDPDDVNGNGIVDAGDTVQFTFDVENTGQVPMSGITVDDPLVGAVTCPEDTLAAGDVQTCAADDVYTITPADVENGSVENTATATGTTPDGDDVTSTPSTTTVEIPPVPALSVVKTADAEAVEVGQTITYSFVVTNTGNVTITDPAVNETSFSGTGELSAIECPEYDASLAPGEEFTCTATYEVTQADIDSGELTNSATVTGTTPSGDPIESDPSTSAVSTDPAPALALVKTADVTTLTDAGEVVTYSFEVTNTGNVTVTDVVINETSFSGTGELSAIECPEEAASLAPGDEVTCTATYEATQADIEAGELTNSATVTGTTLSGDPIESTSSTSTITADADDPDDPAGPGGSANPGGPGSLANTGSDLLGAGIAATLLLLLGGGAVGLRRYLRNKPEVATS